MGEALLAGLFDRDLDGDKPLTTSSFIAEKKPCFFSIFHKLVRIETLVLSNFFFFYISKEMEEKFNFPPTEDGNFLYTTTKKNKAGKYGNDNPFFF